MKCLSSKCSATVSQIISNPDVPLGTVEKKDGEGAHDFVSLIVDAHFFQRAMRGADPSAASLPPKNT